MCIDSAVNPNVTDVHGSMQWVEPAFCRVYFTDCDTLLLSDHHVNQCFATASGTCRQYCRQPPLPYGGGGRWRYQETGCSVCQLGYPNCNSYSKMMGSDLWKVEPRDGILATLYSDINHVYFWWIDLGFRVFYGRVDYSCIVISVESGCRSTDLRQ
jgi:hypothetical protein